MNRILDPKITVIAVTKIIRVSKVTEFDTSGIMAIQLIVYYNNK